MAWLPKPAGPRTTREFFHWAWQSFKTVGALLGEYTESTQPEPPGVEPPPTPAAHSHWLGHLVNVDTTYAGNADSIAFDQVTGYWRPALRTKVFFQTEQPDDFESRAGDLWVPESFGV